MQDNGLSLILFLFISALLNLKNGIMRKTKKSYNGLIFERKKNFGNSQRSFKFEANLAAFFSFFQIAKSKISSFLAPKQKIWFCVEKVSFPLDTGG